MSHASRILIVDDEPFNVDYLEQELEDLGYATASASNGREALEKITAQAPDLILKEAANGTRLLSIHMGLNSGLALVGSTRFEGVHGTRWTFTASGPVTNLAARLAATAEAGQLLVGPETVRRLGDGYRMERLGHAHLKNLDEAVAICRVLGPSIATY